MQWVWFLDLYFIHEISHLQAVLEKDMFERYQIKKFLVKTHTDGL